MLATEKKDDMDEGAQIVLQYPLFQDEVEGEQVTLQQLQATALHHYNHLPH